MSENGDGKDNGKERVTLPLEALIDELTVRYNRADGTMQITGRAANDEVALDIFQRAARLYESRVRIAHATAARDAMIEQQRVQDLVNRTRGGRG